MKHLFLLSFLLLSSIAFCQDKIIDVEVTSLTREAVAVTITLSFAAIVRWFEKRKMKREFRKNGQ